MLYGVLFEETEIYTSVCYMSYKAWVLREVVILSVLENEESVLFEHIPVQNHIRYFSKLFKGIWRVGKYKVVLCCASAYKTEYVISYDFPVPVVE